MKKFMLISALATLAACSPAATTDEAAAPPETAKAVAAVAAADGGPAFGTFRVTGADGKVSVDEIRADGTYTTTAEGEEPKTGTWEQRPGSFCITPSGEGATEKCYAENVDENGVWKSVDPTDGAVSTVERVTT